MVLVPQASATSLGVLPGGDSDTDGEEAGGLPDSRVSRKVMWLAMMRASQRWSRPVKDRATALNHLAVVFEGRVPG